MRNRLLTAVRTLLSDDRIAGRKDVVRLGILVLLAKASFGTCRLEITARELARWLGVSESTVDHEVLSALREAEIVVARVLRGEDGLPTGAEYRVEPLWEALANAEAPLAMSKAELATLLRFLERLFAPGWGEQCATPPGLLMGHRGRHQGRGAASDRLALVLLALHARPDGRVPLVGGPLAKKTARHGRGAATLAGMLDCPVPVAATVLRRLQTTEAVTGGSERLRVPAVADAHRSVGAESPSASDNSTPAEPPATSAKKCAGCAEHDEASEAFPVEGDGWRQLSWGDLEVAEEASETAPREPNGTESSIFAGQDAFEDHDEDPRAAELHADHALVADVCGEGADDLWFSGEAESGCCRRPECACEGKSSPEPGAEHQPDVPGADRAGGLPPFDTPDHLSTDLEQMPLGEHVADDQLQHAQDGPLRGEKPFPVSSAPFQLRSVGPVPSKTAAAHKAWTSGVVPQQHRHVLPADLVHVLSSVRLVWVQVRRPGARRRMAAAVRAELVRLRGVVGPELADQVLAERLDHRFGEQEGKPVTDPVGWLLGRGLPQRAGCYSLVCDEGRRMDTGGDCESCHGLIGDRRALRSAVTARTAAEMPGAEPQALRDAVETRLGRAVAEQAALELVRRERAVAEQAVRRAAVALRREELAEMEEARLSAPCEQCGMPEAAGLCLVCTKHQEVEAALVAAVDLAVVTRVDREEWSAVRHLWEQCAADTRALIRERTDPMRAAGASAEAVAFTEAELARELLERRRVRALERILQGEEASSAAQAAYLSKRRHSLSETDIKLAETAGEQARWRTARNLLEQLLSDVRATRGARTSNRQRTDWQRRCAELAARPIGRETAAHELVGAL